METKEHSGVLSAKQIFKAIAFTTIFILILIPVSYITRTSGDVKDRFVGFYAEPKDTIDVAMIGSSPIHPYFSGPMMYGEHGFTTYQLSSNQQRPEAATYLIQEMEKRQNPKLYVFELRQYAATTESMTANMSYARGLTDNLRYSWNRVKLINEIIDDPMERYTYYFDIMKYHANWSSLFRTSQLKTFDYAYPSELKGFQFVEKVNVMYEWDYSYVTETESLPDTREQDLYRLLDYLKEHDMQALFIVSPVAMQDESYMAKFNYMEPIVRSYGYDFVNMNKMFNELEIDFRSDFYDGGAHMNALGAEKCSAYLGQYISEHYPLEDKRGQQAYASWDNAYTVWQEKLAYMKEHWDEMIEKDFT